MRSIGPRIPTELVDRIISYLIKSTNDDETALMSSYALVGSMWRARINEHRYLGISIFMGADTTVQLEALADICTSKVWAADEGVARHVEVLFIHRGGRFTDKTAAIIGRSSARDAAVVRVLRSVFRDKTRRPRGGRTCLGITKGHNSRGGFCGFDFSTLGVEIIAALGELIRTANIDALQLEGVWGVPWDFIASATLVELFMDRVKFLLPAADSTRVVLPQTIFLPKLDEIHLEHSPSFITGITSAVHWLPPPVTTIYITYDSDHEHTFYDVLCHLGRKLTSLTIEIEFSLWELCTPIDYSKVHVREDLSINMKYSIYHGGEGATDVPQIPAFQSVVQFLPPTPPCKINIVFDVSALQFDPPANARGCVDDIYSELYHASLPEYLEGVTTKAPDTDIDILLLVNVQVAPGATYGSAEVYKAHEKYLLEQFSCLRGMRGVTFRVEVYEADDLDSFRLT